MHVIHFHPLVIGGDGGGGETLLNIHTQGIHHN